MKEYVGDSDASDYIHEKKKNVDAWKVSVHSLLFFVVVFICSVQ